MSPLQISSSAHGCADCALSQVAPSLPAPSDLPGENGVRRQRGREGGREGGSERRQEKKVFLYFLQ